MPQHISRRTWVWIGIGIGCIILFFLMLWRRHHDAPVTKPKREEKVDLLSRYGDIYNID